MSRLSVYWPDEMDSTTVGTDEHMILPFPSLQIRAIANSDSPPMDVVTRARVLFANRKCRDCGYPVVEPIELSDSAVNHSGLAIPGTATPRWFPLPWLPKRMVRLKSSRSNGVRKMKPCSIN